MKICEGNKQEAQWLEEKLLSSLSDTNVQAENSNIILTARETKERIMGGLVASTSYGWLLVKILWVDSNYRGTGIGRSLVKQAELSALTRGCHGAWLDTSNRAAYRFYENLGYQTFGELHNTVGQTPAGHQRWFMKKTFPALT